MMTLTIVVSIDSRPEDGDEADPSTQESDPGRPPLILTRDVSDGGQGGGGPKQHDQCHVVERFKEVLPPLWKKGRPSLQLSVVRNQKSTAGAKNIINDYFKYLGQKNDKAPAFNEHTTCSVIVLPLFA